MLAVDGEAALYACGEALPDLAILDVMMPGTDGLQVCGQLKRRTGGEFVPVLMLTARDTIDDKIAALQEGADDYLTKPFKFKELQIRIEALLRMRDLNLQLQAKNEELAAMQQKLVEQERQLVANQLAGTAAHGLGQPLSAITLNCHLLEVLSPDDPKYQHALYAIKSDVKRMVGMLEKLRNVDARQTREYYDGVDILEIEPVSSKDGDPK
ncbi:MAG: response regulator [Deltaproteobacteria bacterium]|nr:response regulator [Deltaproteobacteria bacterium]